MKLVFTERRAFPVQGVLCSEQTHEVDTLKIDIHPKCTDIPKQRMSKNRHIGENDD